jgi:5-methylcytosine-specific restriction enzyme subunit McrC
MKAAETIRIENVYYMLAYAFKALREGPHAKIDPDEFASAEDLFGWILGLGMSRIVKQGLYREYAGVADDLPGLRGRIGMSGTMKHRTARRPLLAVEYDEFSDDNPFNRILKTAATALFRSGRLKVSKDLLANSLAHFAAVQEVRPRDIRWNGFRYQRSNRQYRMLMSVCRFVLEGMMIAEKSGDTRVRHLDFRDADMLCDLYEAFVREYFARHFGLPTKTREIRWDVQEDADCAHLPKMQADTVLEKDAKALIIDTKFYGSILTGKFGGKISNGHLYQVLAYVNNYQAHHADVQVSGMLLYAKTTIDDFNAAAWTIGSHRMDVRVLNLDQRFSAIRTELDKIVSDYFGDIPRRN